MGVRDGKVRASARVLREGEKHWVLEPANTARGQCSPGSSRSMLNYLAAAARQVDAVHSCFAGRLRLNSANSQRLPRARLAFSDRPGTPFAAVLAAAGVRTDRKVGVYARLVDPLRLLDRIRPVLSRRLAASPSATEQGTLVVSCYRFGLALDYDRGTVTASAPPRRRVVGPPRRAAGRAVPEGPDRRVRCRMIAAGMNGTRRPSV